MYHGKIFDRTYADAPVIKRLWWKFRRRWKDFKLNFDLVIMKESFEKFIEQLFAKGRAKYQIIEFSDLFCDSVIQMLIWGDLYPTLYKNISDCTSQISFYLCCHNVDVKVEDLIEWVVRVPVDDDEQLMNCASHLIFQGEELFEYEKVKEFDKETLIKNFNGFINEYFTLFIWQGYIAAYEVKEICKKWMINSK